MNLSNGRISMPEETWHGIPRTKIPWYPTINYDKCQSCGKCVEYCMLGTYEFEQKGDKKIPVVKNPYNCVMMCSGCDPICPAGAIQHPSKKVIHEKIQELRKDPSLKLRKN